jgi:hypothetical protein
VKLDTHVHTRSGSATVIPFNHFMRESANTPGVYATRGAAARPGDDYRPRSISGAPLAIVTTSLSVAK